MSYTGDALCCVVLRIMFLNLHGSQVRGSYSARGTALHSVPEPAKPSSNKSRCEIRNVCVPLRGPTLVWNETYSYITVGNEATRAPTLNSLCDSMVFGYLRRA